MGQSSPEVKKAWLERNKHKRPEINRNHRLRKVYGISKEQFNDLYQLQGGKCAICKGVLDLNRPDDKNQLHIDHDHRTKWVRGLLCGRCNLGIGQFEDSIDLLQNAIEYLISGATPTEFMFSAIPNPPRRVKNDRYIGGYEISESTKLKISESMRKVWAARREEEQHASTIR